MRSLVVFGRGGPRGPPAQPRYLSQAPPKLKYGIQSILKGNPFEILASIPEISYSEIQDNHESTTQFNSTQGSIVHQSEIPDSVLQENSSNYNETQEMRAPDLKNMSSEESGNDYTIAVRGRSKKQYFHKKIKQSTTFSRKLKESFLTSSLSKATIPMSETASPALDHHEPGQSQEPSPPNEQAPDLMEIEKGLLSGISQPDNLLSPDAPMDDVTAYPTPHEFDLSPEEENALLSHDMTSQPPGKSSLQKSLAANTIQPDIKRFFATSKTTNIPSVPSVPTDKGTHIGTFASAASTVSQSPVEPNVTSYPSLATQEHEHVRKVSIRTNAKLEITCRFKIRIEGGTCNLPLLVKQVVKLYRGVDSSLTVLPISDPNNDSLILDNEDSIPETEDELKKWVTYVIPHFNRVHFTMRFTIMKSLSSISGPIFAWMKLNRSYVKMDTIRSEKIVTLGFFEGFHPDFQSRDKFKQFCYNHIVSKNKNLDEFGIGDFSIYPRAVYIGSTVDKVTTRAMVIEVSADQSSPVLTALSSSLSGVYAGVTFVPFTKMDKDYQVILKMAMLKQNTFLHTIKRKQIKGLINPHQILQKKDGQELSFCQWLQSARDEMDEDSPIIQSVEETRYNSSSILYYQKHTEKVLTFCKNLKENMEEHFPPSAVTTVFTDTYAPMLPTLSRIISDEESTWASIIKRKYLPNPQDDDILHSPSNSLPPSKQRKSVYYGTTKTPTPLREDTHVQIARIPDTGSVDSLTSELSLKYQELEKQVKSLLQSQEQNQQDTKAYVDNSIAAMEETLNAQYQQNTDMIQKQISAMESNNTNQFSALTQTLNAVAGNMNILLSNFNLGNASSAALPKSTTTTAPVFAVGSGKH